MMFKVQSNLPGKAYQAPAVRIISLAIGKGILALSGGIDDVNEEDWYWDNPGADN